MILAHLWCVVGVSIHISVKAGPMMHQMYQKEGSLKLGAVYSIIVERNEPSGELKLCPITLSPKSRNISIKRHILFERSFTLSL